MAFRKFKLIFASLVSFIPLFSHADLNTPKNCASAVHSDSTTQNEINLPQISETRTGFYAFFPNGAVKFYDDKGLIRTFIELTDPSHLGILRRQYGEARVDKMLSSAEGISQLKELIVSEKHPLEMTIEEYEQQKMELQAEINEVPSNQPLNRALTKKLFSFLERAGLYSPTASSFAKSNFSTKISKAKFSGEQFRNDFRFVTYEAHLTPQRGPPRLVTFDVYTTSSIHLAAQVPIEDLLDDRAEYIHRGYVRVTATPSGKVTIVKRRKD